LSEEFIEIIADMMDKDPRSRIQSAAEVAARLELFAGEGTVITPRTIRSPWSAPPLPSAVEEEEPAESDTSEHSASGGDTSGSQYSQGTLAASGQETPAYRSRIREAPLVQPAAGNLSQTAVIAMTLMISIPLSMLVGALIATLAFWVWR
jgi:hypothetical protein